MQYMKRIVVVGCLLVATSAGAQYGWDGEPTNEPAYEWPGSRQYEQSTPNLDEFSREAADRHQQRMDQLQPWMDYNRQRSACDAIQGNDAARADCFRGLGGW